MTHTAPSNCCEPNRGWAPQRHPPPPCSPTLLNSLGTHAFLAPSCFRCQALTVICMPASLHSHPRNSQPLSLETAPITCPNLARNGLEFFLLTFKISQPVTRRLLQRGAGSLQAGHHLCRHTGNVRARRLD